MASCGSHKFPVTMDTGASVTILQKEVVHPKDLTGNTIPTKCTNDSPLVLEEASTEFTISSKRLKIRVGVVPGDQIGGTRLLSIPLLDEEKWQLFTDLIFSQMNSTRSEPLWTRP